uniref:Uncharacterized protein n=1 Tax=Bionectria ochroleuca TaxID=29856 RepID=A0A8H7NC42_BIOOC
MKGAYGWEGSGTKGDTQIEAFLLRTGRMKLFGKMGVAATWSSQRPGRSSQEHTKQVDIALSQFQIQARLTRTRALAIHHLLIPTAACLSWAAAAWRDSHIVLACSDTVHGWDMCTVNRPVWCHNAQQPVCRSV